MITVELIKKTIATFQNGASYEYFFARASSPEWIVPLREGGLFSDPPPIKRTAEGISFPSWVESQFLARVSKASPGPVLDTILAIPPTDNERIHMDYADAAMQMPIKLAAKWARKEMAWLKGRQLYLLLPEKVADLALHLSRAGQKSVATGLFECLLSLHPDSRTEEDRTTEAGFPFAPDPRPTFDRWEYDRILKNQLTQAAASLGIEAVKLLIRLLERAIVLSQDPKPEREPFHDMSCVWRPSIEDHEQNRDTYDLLSPLSGTLRDVCLQQIASAPNQFLQVIHLLMEQVPKRAILWRIVLFLLNNFPDLGEAEIPGVLKDEALFGSVDCRHEYRALLRNRFKGLPAEDMRLLLKRIWNTTTLAEVSESLSRIYNRPPTAEEKAQYLAMRRLEWLTLLEENLPPLWKAKRDRLVERYGPGREEGADFPVFMEGPSVAIDKSPLSVDQLKEMPLDDLILFLNKWTPDGIFMGASRRGLGGLLQLLVAERIPYFAEHTSSFHLAEPTYVRCFLDAFTEAAEKGVSFEWSGILDLCIWVINQPRDSPSRDPIGEIEDPGWKWARQSITRLLSAGLQAKSAPIPKDCAEKALTIIEVLLTDPEPTVEDEEKYCDRNCRPYDYALNCVRGSAMLALMRYATWLRGSTKDWDDTALTPTEEGLRFRVLSLFNDHLDPALEKSKAVRSAYGVHLPWLILFDETWVRSHLADLFPKDIGLEDLYNATWNSYVTWCQPYDKPFDILGDEYEWAAQHLSEGGVETTEDKVAEKLGEHLILYYWRGKTTLEAESPLSTFLRNASDETRGRTTSFVGHVLKNSRSLEKTEDQRILQRLQEYWNSRVREAKESSKPELYRKEMAAFGWWVITEKYEPGWTLENLERALEIAGGVDMAPDVQDYLAAMSKSHTEKALACLRLILQADRNTWDAAWAASREQANRQVIESALSSAKPETVAEAVELIHQLGTMGFFGYRDLLPPKNPPSENDG